MIVTIASGKGGTGKTTLAVNLATALSRCEALGVPVRLLDCDVEEPNDHLFVRPNFTRTESVEVLKPVWNEELCTGCGECARACRHNALAVVKGKVLAFPELCHACGACTFVCPEGAMRERNAPIGKVELDEEREDFAFAHGVLNIAESLAPKVVQAVKRHADPDGITIIDAAPGTACPVVAALRGADAAILVTEPTPFGLNDLKLALALSLRLGVPSGIVVNRSDGTDALIERYAHEVGVPIIGRIPFKREYAETYSRGDLLLDFHPELGDALLGIYEGIRTIAAGPAQEPPEEEAPQRPEPRVRRAARRAASRATGACRETTVISGKGGTGKTTVVASLSALLDDMVLADCDVDAADLHLLLRPRLREAEDFFGGMKATISAEDCTGCGRCAEMCHFDAIEPAEQAEDGEPVAYRVNELACEGCGLCAHVCPVDAVQISPALTGRSFASETDYGMLSHARLGIGEENSGKLVTRVRNRASNLAREEGAAGIMGDGSPGTGCPVIASISGVDVALVVTEPTVSGVHDLERVLELTRHFGVRALICINKCDLNAQQAERIRELARRTDARVVGEIPFDEEVNEALMNGCILSECGTGPAARAIRALGGALRDETLRQGAPAGIR